MKAIETVQLGLISVGATVAVSFAVITALPHDTTPSVHHHPAPTVVHHDDLTPLFVVPQAPPPAPAPGGKVPVVPAEPWLPFGQRGILA